MDENNLEITFGVIHGHLMASWRSSVGMGCLFILPHASLINCYVPLSCESSR